MLASVSSIATPAKNIEPFHKRTEAASTDATALIIDASTMSITYSEYTIIWWIVVATNTAATITASVKSKSSFFIQISF